MASHSGSRVAAAVGACRARFGRLSPSGLRHLCIEEGPPIACPYEILSPHVQELAVVSIIDSRWERTLAPSPGTHSGSFGPRARSPRRKRSHCPTASGAGASARQVGAEHFDGCPFGHAHWYVIVFPQPWARMRPSADDSRLMSSTEQTRLYAARDFTLLNLGTGVAMRLVSVVE